LHLWLDSKQPSSHDNSLEELLDRVSNAREELVAIDPCGEPDVALLFANESPNLIELQIAAGQVVHLGILQYGPSLSDPNP
jgi:hypothetical protein